MRRSKRRKLLFPLALPMNQRRPLLQEGVASTERSRLRSNQEAPIATRFESVAPPNPSWKSHSHVSIFFLVLPNSLLPFSAESTNITNSSTPQATGTSATMAVTYDRSPALVLSSVAGSRSAAPDGGRGSRGKSRAGKRLCRHAWSFSESW